MKQKITLEQVKELNVEGYLKYERWVMTKGYSFFLNIGQMIEFLGEHEYDLIMDYWNYLDLCDHLWKAIKEVLNKNEE